MLRKGVSEIPDSNALKQLREMGLDPANPPPKRKRGRPKGSRNPPGVDKASHSLIDPKTGVIVTNNSSQCFPIAKMGDERVTAFVQYHIDMMHMRMGVNKKDVPDLYNRFYRYLGYCAEKGIIPNNMNAYFAIGLVRQDIARWKSGVGSPEQRQFADDITQFFASIHEQAGGENIVNPILSIYWSKAHDGMIEASKVEVINNDPLGEKRSAEQIYEQYADILPDE